MEEIYIVETFVGNVDVTIFKLVTHSARSRTSIANMQTL